VKALLTGGASVEITDERGFNAVHYLCWHWGNGSAQNNMAILNALLEFAQKKNMLEQRDIKGRTPLLIACKRSCGEAVVALIGTKTFPITCGLGESRK